MESLYLVSSLVLTSYQVAALKSFLGIVEGHLRIAPNAAQPRGDQKTDNENYGTVWPLDFEVPAAALPSATQPIFILRLVSSK